LNCFQVRRALLTTPRARDEEMRAHLASCNACAGMASRLGDIEHEIEQAALVPVPDGLAHRVLLQRSSPSKWRYASAAMVIGALVSLALMLPGAIDALEFAGTAEAVGPAHPGVAAISLIANEEPNVDRSAKISDPAEIEHSLNRLGLTLGSGPATSYYVGKCHVAAGDCDHILFSTPEGHANVLLLPDYTVSQRVLVTDRDLTALVTPAPQGGYIVVAPSPKIAKRTQRLFRRG
jgi:hypothetical protein